MSHVALDNRREDPEPVIIVPYFPRGLAKSTEQPLDFNFTLYLYEAYTALDGQYLGFRRS